MTDPHPEIDALSADRVGVVAVSDRSGVVESIHHGVAVALDGDGSVMASVGDVGTHVFPRSALKPLQAAAMVDNGLELPAPLLALATASHSGEAHHLDGVREILRRHGLSVDDLRNTPDRPIDDGARADALLAGIEPSSLQQNCSGKHAAMLSTCVVNGWSTAEYLDVDHPLQQAIVATLRRHGVDVVHIGVDGCGAPTQVVSLRALAAALGRLAASGSTVTTAMAAHPLMVSGTHRDERAWADAVPGLVAKVGAQGVMTLATPDGRAAALKIADGSLEARQAVTVQALRHLGVDVDGEHAEVRDRVVVATLGHGRPVGETTAVPWRTPGR